MAKKAESGDKAQVLKLKPEGEYADNSFSPKCKNVVCFIFVKIILQRHYKYDLHYLSIGICNNNKADIIYKSEALKQYDKRTSTFVECQKTVAKLLKYSLLFQGILTFLGLDHLNASVIITLHFVVRPRNQYFNNVLSIIYLF